MITSPAFWQQTTEVRLAWAGATTPWGWKPANPQKLIWFMLCSCISYASGVSFDDIRFCLSSNFLILYYNLLFSVLMSSNFKEDDCNFVFPASSIICATLAACKFVGFCKAVAIFMDASVIKCLAVSCSWFCSRSICSWTCNRLNASSLFFCTAFNCSLCYKRFLASSSLNCFTFFSFSTSIKYSECAVLNRRNHIFRNYNWNTWTM